MSKGRPPLYDWDKLLDGATHLIRQRKPDEIGAPKWDEIDTDIPTFRKAASAAAKRREVRVRIKDDGGQYFAIQAFPIGARRPTLDLYGAKHTTEVEITVPDENVCRICSGLIQGGQLAVGLGYRTCQIMDGWDRVGPFHTEDTGEYDDKT